MNKIVTSLLTAALGLALTLPAFAEHGEMGTHCQMHGKKTLDETDTNHDGMMSKDEAMAAWGQQFDQMDTNKDGNLSKDELAVSGSYKLDKKASAMHKKLENELNAADTDKSGTLSKKEAQKMQGIAKHFDAIDTNKDGGLDSDEVSYFMHHHPSN
jgi:Ca2+-binding EF-hand superfamily protein